MAHLHTSQIIVFFCIIHLYQIHQANSYHPIHLFIYSFINLIIYSFIHLFIYSFIHLFIYLFFSFIDLFILLFATSWYPKFSVISIKKKLFSLFYFAFMQLFLKVFTFCINSWESCRQREKFLKIQSLFLRRLLRNFLNGNSYYAATVGQNTGLSSLQGFR